MTRLRIAILLCPLLLLAGCGGGGGGSEADDDRLRIVATTGQVADLVRNVGGDRVRVEALMGPGIDPHLYQASAGDVERLRRADLVVYNGLHLESKMGEVLAELGKRKPVLAVAETLPRERLLSPEDYEGQHDPHAWFDVDLWRLGLDAVADRLAELDPEHAGAHRDRAARHNAELVELHGWARAEFASVPKGQRVLITAHDAFNYLGRAYDLEVRGLQGLSTATEAGTADVQDLSAFIAERRIPAIFVETSVPPRAIEAVRQAVRARGFEVVVGGEVFSDALGDPGSPAGTYVGMVRHNVETIVAALRGEPGHE